MEAEGLNPMADDEPVEQDTTESKVEIVRKPWATPRIIVSKARQTNKTANTFESTFGPFHFGPS